MTSSIDIRQNTLKRGLTVEEFCRLYSLGRTLAYQEINAGRLRARKVGRKTIVTHDDAEAWLHQLPPFQPISGSINPRGGTSLVHPQRSASRRAGRRS